MEVPKQILKAKLTALNSTQASIETTSKYILFYSDDAEAIVQVWHEEFARSPTDRKLALLYVANHVMQLGKKKAKDWVAEFSK
jgi:regulator of Ty1 transposition protein 103